MDTDLVKEAQAVLGGASAEETLAAERRLLEAAQVNHLTFEQLTDVVAERNLDLEQDFISVTIAMANNSSEEEWRS